jgi:hypothetical protein
METIAAQHVQPPPLGRFDEAQRRGYRSPCLNRFNDSILLAFAAV